LKSHYAPRKPLYVGKLKVEEKISRKKIELLVFVKIFLPKKILFYPKKKICTKRA